MVGISYFAMTQLEAAVERPPHLKAIFPVAVTIRPLRGGPHARPVQLDVRHAVPRHGRHAPRATVTRSGGAGSRRRSEGAGHPPALHRAVRHHERRGSRHRMRAQAMRSCTTTRIRGTTCGSAIAVEHQARDEWWDERNLVPLLDQIDGARLPRLRLGERPPAPPGTFSTLAALTSSPHVRVAMLGEHGLTWPWESLHVEALAWFDHWLKAADTGILDGPPIRYWLPGTDDWRTAEHWPPPPAPGCSSSPCAPTARSPSRRATPGARSYVCPGPGLGRELERDTDPPASPGWATAPSTGRGPGRQRGAPARRVHHRHRHGLDRAARRRGARRVRGDRHPGWLQASLREVDDDASLPGAPVLRCRTPEAVPAQRSSPTGSRSCPTPDGSPQVTASASRVQRRSARRHPRGDGVPSCPGGHHQPQHHPVVVAARGVRPAVVGRTATANRARFAEAGSATMRSRVRADGRAGAG